MQIDPLGFEIIYRLWFLYKLNMSEAEELARWLGALAALAEDPGLIPRTHAASHIKL